MKEKKRSKEAIVTVIRTKQPDLDERKKALEEIGRLLFEEKQSEENTM